MNTAADYHQEQQPMNIGVDYHQEQQPISTAVPHRQKQQPMNTAVDCHQEQQPISTAVAHRQQQQPISTAAFHQQQLMSTVMCYHQPQQPHYHVPSRPNAVVASIVSTQPLLSYTSGGVAYHPYHQQVQGHEQGPIYYVQQPGGFLQKPPQDTTLSGLKSGLETANHIVDLTSKVEDRLCCLFRLCL
jgi:hypothetical protein